MYEIIIDKNKVNTQILILENGILVEKYEKKERLEGNIYVGKIKNKVEGMQAAFVDIGEAHNAFIHNRDMETEAKAGSPILVQIKKEETTKKGAKLTTKIMLTGRYIILMPNASFITISQKIEDEKERNRLLEIVKQMIPEKCGSIIRTSAEGKEKEELQEEMEKLIKQWERIKNTKIEEFPKKVYQSPTMLQKIILDLVDKKATRILVNDLEVKKQVEQELQNIEEKIEVVYQEDVLSCFGLETALAKLENRKIWLKSGAFITIDKTEALTAIDVNSGKYIGKQDLEQTSYEVNAEATEEIAKQIRLRDIGGIIIIDYIDMNNEENKEKIKELLKKYCKKDRSKTQIEEFTRLNLLEMTRKHMFSND